MLGSRLGSLSAIKLLGILTIYYALVFLVLLIMMRSFPSLQNLMPFGGGSEFNARESANSFSQTMIFSNLSSNYIENGLKLLFAILGVIQVMLPVTWVYLKIRAKLDQSLVENMLILPVVVAGVVIIVQNSLALAFSRSFSLRHPKFRQRSYI